MLTVPAWLEQALHPVYLTPPFPDLPFSALQSRFHKQVSTRIVAVLIDRMVEFEVLGQIHDLI